MNQRWDADEYSKNADFVSKFAASVVDLLNPKSGESILDLGCGDGSLSLEIATSGAIVQGVDSSPEMVMKSQELGVSVQQMSGESLVFDNEFDAVFSNAALHWMLKPDLVIQGVHKALKPHGRFVGEFGGKGNIASLVEAMAQVFAVHSDFPEFQNPWYFPDVEGYKEKLESNGFEVETIELIPRPTPLPLGIKEWLSIFSQGVTSQLSVAQKSLFLNEVEKLVKPKLFQSQQWVADYVRLRFLARKI